MKHQSPSLNLGDVQLVVCCCNSEPDGATMPALAWLLFTYLLSDDSTASPTPVMQLMGLLCLSEVGNVDGTMELLKLPASLLMSSPQKLLSAAL